MTRNQKKKQRIHRVWIGLLAVLAAVGIVAGIFFTTYFPFQSMLIKRSSTSLDFRDRELTLEEYRELREKIPDCRILWQIPIGSEKYDSTAREISIDSLNLADLERFFLFEDLQQIHVEGLECYAELEQMERVLPDCRIDWCVILQDRKIDRMKTQLDLTGSGVESEELLEELKWLTQLREVEVRDAVYSPEEREMLRNAYPGIRFVWPVEVAGKTWLSTQTHLSYAGETPDVQVLAAAAGEFIQVQELDLSGCGLSVEELLVLQEAYPNTRIQSELSLHGLEFTTAAETLDFSGTVMEDTQALEQLLPLMHSLTWVDMCDCGISDEEMDALNKRYDPIRFVWRIRFSVYSLRTDATFFCGSDLSWNGFVAIKMTDEQLEPLKYCEDLIALDLGHMRYTDLSFLENMPKLQYLILVDAKFTDITPIGTLKELKYLELFMNTIEDLSPLLNCPELKHLNIGYTSGFDTAVLKQFTGLERLWYPANTMSQEEIAELKAALPNTLCHLPWGDPDGSTGNGWREAEIYFEMRDIFSMHYMPGGTGMGRD